jgi:hypothetical protein
LRSSSTPFDTPRPPSFNPFGCPPRFRQAGQHDGEALPFGSAVDVLATFDPDKDDDDDEETPVWEKYNACLHGPR